MSSCTEETKVEGEEAKYPLVSVRGLLLPKPFMTRNVIEEVMDYKPDDDDIFIVTYPKCGTTWTQFLVWEIMHKGAPPPTPNQMMFQHIPFLEFTGVKLLDDLPRPRVMKTHLPFHLQPYNKSAKYIYVVRNPWDCCVSYYHHHCWQPQMPKLTFDQFFKLFITGELGFGDFFDHVLSWFDHKHDTNVLFLTYEEMKTNTRKVLLKIASFLGDTYYQSLQDNDVLDNCLKYSDFQYLKQMGMFVPKSECILTGMEHIKELTQIEKMDKTEFNEKFKEIPFFRKGIIGDGKNHLSQEQIKIFNKHMIEKLKNTPMENFWKPLEEETSL